MIFILSFHDVVIEKISSEHIPESVGPFWVKYMKEVGIQFLSSIPEIFQIVHPVVLLTNKFFVRNFPTKSYLSK